MSEVHDRDNLEAEWVKRLGSKMKPYRDRLIKLLGNPPDVDGVPQAFWDEIENDLGIEIAQMEFVAYAMSGLQHGGDPKTIEAEAAAHALKRSKELTHALTDNTKAMLFDWLDREFGPEEVAISDVAAGRAGRLDDDGLARMTDKVNEVLGEPRAEKVAATEVTDASTSGGEKAVHSSGNDDSQDIWWTRDDSKVCKICQPLHKQPRPVWESQFPEGPPSHPLCRCWIDYARAATMPDRSADFVIRAELGDAGSFVDADETLTVRQKLTLSIEPS